VLLNGIIVNKFGQKRAVIGALISLSCTLFIVFFAPDIKILLVGRILCGLPRGVFASSAPAYASEVLPLSLRVYMTSYTNMVCISSLI
jgi:SP family general alpha glucoside:H+ symporter-like MFS transporter